VAGLSRFNQPTNHHQHQHAVPGTPANQQHVRSRHRRGEQRACCPSPARRLALGLVGSWASAPRALFAAALAAACGHRAMVAPACFCLPAPGPPSLPDAAESSCRLVLVAGAPSWALCLPRRAPLICGARRAAFGSMQISLPVAAPRPSCERNQIAFAFPLDPAC
jgi:hypothetical protein